METGVYSAEYGHEPSQVNVTTKSGSNQFHGAAFEFLRNSALDARQWQQAGRHARPLRQIALAEMTLQPPQLAGARFERGLERRHPAFEAGDRQLGRGR